MLDLSALDAPLATATGEPLKLKIEDVIEDPTQPRVEFPEGPLQELADDIKERGVKTPVSVKPMNSDGKYILNFGARRRRAAIMAGLNEIPAFIDADIEDYDQVNENEQRHNLSPLELALFIQKRLDAKDSRADIARKLRKDKAFITFHLALINAPDCIMALYRSGKCTTARNIYELTLLYNKHSEAVALWCETVAEVTRKDITDLSIKLEGEKELADSSSASPQKDDHQFPPIVDQAGKGSEGVPPQKGEPRPESAGQKENNPDKIKKPVLMVKHGKRSAVVLLDRRPTVEGHVFIRYHEGEGDAVEVPANVLKIDRLIDSGGK